MPEPYDNQNACHDCGGECRPGEDMCEDCKENLLYGYEYGQL